MCKIITSESTTSFIKPVKKRSLTGFTIVELIIVLSILVILTSMTAVIFRATQKSFTDARAFQHVINLARQAVLRMHDEIKATFIDFSQLANFVGIDETGPQIKGNSQSDEIFFIWPEGGLSSGTICEVGYWQREDGNLMRHYDNPPDFNFSTVDSDDELGIVVSQLDFKYFDGENYVDLWDSRIGGAEEGRFPKAIKFSFQVSDEDSLVTKKFESLVRIASSGR
ncbi:MAG: type II secretion system GspH family protein [Candidatus Omnitrophica bacterium]|nr:type II secretion system GspH family protein [Candidatus Omnitrophota bacterium]